MYTAPMSPALHLNFGTEVRDGRAPFHRIELNVQLELVGLVHGPSVSFDTVVNVITPWCPNQWTSAQVRRQSRHTQVRISAMTTQAFRR